MQFPEITTSAAPVIPVAPAPSAAANPLPLRVLLRFADASSERRFVEHYVAFYFRFAQVSLLLGLLLIVGDFFVDHLADSGGQANVLRLSVGVPLLLLALAYSASRQARLRWQPVMAGFIAILALCLFEILLSIDAQGGAGLKTWVGILNFTFLEFYCFVILGVQFRYALGSGLLILGIFEHALWFKAGLSASQAMYWSYHVVTLFMLAAGIGWWREFLLRKEFMSRTALDESRVAAERLAIRLANYDDVTGLPNRRLFSEMAGPALERARRNGACCAVLHADIDRFAWVNDSYGRSGGDAVLATLAQRLRSWVRSSDVTGVNASPAEAGVVARLGGNAFSILITDLANQEQATLVAQRLLAAVAQPIDIEGSSAAQPLVLSASIGIAMFPGDAPDLAGLTGCAEQAARAAKLAGRGQHRFFDEALNVRAKERLLLETELRHAIHASQLRLHYQPKVDARSGRIVGAEALVRWQHPDRGLLAPGQFIGLAEETGLILPLTTWVLDTACSKLRQWADAGLPWLPLSVNLPALSLADAGLLAQLDELVGRHGLNPRDLVLEVTESMLMQDLASVADLLDRLGARGYGLSLDDFGSGYSSLNYLKRLPMTELKIDRAFVTDVARGGRDGALAAAIITLGSELGLQVVAEGVETPEQSAFLLGRGCALQQGYLFSRPIPQADFECLLRAGAGRLAEASLAPA